MYMSVTTASTPYARQDCKIYAQIRFDSPALMEQMYELSRHVISLDVDLPTDFTKTGQFDDDPSALRLGSDHLLVPDVPELEQCWVQNGVIINLLHARERFVHVHTPGMSIQKGRNTTGLQGRRI